MDLARAAGSTDRPTDEQTAVIEAPLESMLVVAGAGSGKTATMAARVVWLVANDLVAPEEVLGLTFTRKAAAELSDRISGRLRRVAACGLWSPPAQDDGSVGLGAMPTVSTYHAYAGRIVSEHALRLGYERETRLLSEAAAWQYAAEVVHRFDGDLAGLAARAPSTLINAVIDLAGEMSEHGLSPDDVDRVLRATIADIESIPETRKGHGETIAKATDSMRGRLVILEMIRRFHDLKRDRDAMDFGDQVALAARLVHQVPTIGLGERERYRCVLLDEFQDTSEAQLDLLRGLFAGGDDPPSVTAVGDPNQSIYGWRGASASTLARFPQDFRHHDGSAATQRNLSTTWRNDERILATANVIAEPLRHGSRVPVEPLRARPGAGAGDVEVARLGTAAEEAAHVVSWLASVRREGSSAAVLCRKRSQFPDLIAALESAALPYEVVGLGGLLLVPEVVDVVSALRVVDDPTRGDVLMRLLTGPIGRLGAADLAGLSAWARILRARDRSAQRPDDVNQPESGRPDSDDRDAVSLADTLDDLPPEGWRGPYGEHIEAAALVRLRRLASALADLRAHAALALPELVGHAERALGLDLELASRPGVNPGQGRVHLDAFIDVAAGFAAQADRPTIRGFLAWLDAALAEERGLDLGPVEPDPDVIQVLTVHAAKGLEWDVVAVPGLAESIFPSWGLHIRCAPTFTGQEWVAPDPKPKAWTGNLTSVPYPIRGDADGLPVWQIRGAQDSTDLEQRRLAMCQREWERVLSEERRLAYVAVTRARHALLLTVPTWTTGQGVRPTSRFVTELLPRLDELGIARTQWREAPTDDERTNPAVATQSVVLWPVSPSRSRREPLDRAAAAIRAAQDGTPDIDLEALWMVTQQGARDAQDVEILLAQREQAATPHQPSVALPGHLTASDLVRLKADPNRLAEDLRRPMPQPPATAARLGTAFHAWVEQHYSRAALVDVDEMPGAADEGAAPALLLPQLQERFLASEWAQQVPEDIEVAIETVIDAIPVRGRIDAVFAREDGGYTVVDWKTGAPPTGRDAQDRAVQLAAYALAYARLRGLDPELVDGAFFYASTGQSVRPALLSEAEMTGLLRLPN